MVKQLLFRSMLVIGPIFSSATMADDYPLKDPMGGEPFGTSVKEIGNGLYVFRWWVYRNIFLVTDEGVIVADPLNPKAAGLLRKEISKITDKPVKYVIYSHNHHDHISGGTVFKEEGAQFIAHENVLMQLGDHPSVVTPLPDITFKSTYTVELGGKSIELTYFGPNHGDSLVVMRLPKEKILFIVDIVTPRQVAFRTMPDFWPDEWIRSLKEIEQLASSTGLFQPKGEISLDLQLFQSVYGPIGQPAQEAVYPGLATTDGKPMKAQHDYVIRMSKDEMPPATQEAIGQGIADAWAEFGELKKKADAGEINSGDAFGTREHLDNNYLYRMAAAVLGIWGNSEEEAIYPAYYVDADGEKLDGSHRYTLRFALDQLPPVEAFWSLTMYELPASLLTENSLGRYLLNSPMLVEFMRDDDRGITLYLQHESPG